MTESHQSVPPGEPMALEVLFFAHTKELAGTGRASVSLAAGSTVADALARLQEDFPALAGHLTGCRVAVNEEFAREEDVLDATAVLAIIPPVSGG